MSTADADRNQGAYADAARTHLEEAIRALRVFQLSAPGRWEFSDVSQVCLSPEAFKRVVAIYRVVEEITSRFWETYRLDRSLSSSEAAQAAKEAALTFIRADPESWRVYGLDEGCLADAIARWPRGPKSNEVGEPNSDANS